MFAAVAFAVFAAAASAAVAAAARRSAGRRFMRRMHAIGNFFSKKFSFKRKKAPGSVANKEFAVLHVGTGSWDRERQRYEHTLTFRPEAMSCGEKNMQCLSPFL